MKTSLLIHFVLILMLFLGCQKEQLVDDLPPESMRYSNVGAADFLWEGSESGDRNHTPIGLLANHAGDRLIAPEAGLPPNYAAQIGNSCQSHAAAWALSWALYRRANPAGQAFSIAHFRSPYFIAYRLRQAGLTAGTGFTDLAQVADRLRQDGACSRGWYNAPANAWHDGNAHFIYLGFANPSAGANNDAAANKAAGYSSLTVSGTGVSLNAIKAAIDNKRAVMLKIWLNWNGNTPVLPIGNYVHNGNNTPNTWHQPAQNARSWVNANAHIVTVYGYNETRNVLYCQNSWGAGWGDNGRFAISVPTLNVNSSQAVYVW